MKKITILLLLASLIVFGTCPVEGAAAETASVTAEIDYITNTINVLYRGVQNYDAYVAVYITKNNASPIAFSDLVKVDKALCKANQSVSFSFLCDESMLTNVYYVYAVLGSSQTGAVGTSLPIVGMADRSIMLSEINAAGETAISPALAVADLIYSKLGTQLQYTAPEAWKNAYVYAIRQKDYNGSFADFSEVESAWKNADQLYAMRQSATSEVLATLLDNNATAFGIDIENKDYKDYKTAFASFLQGELARIDAKSVTDFRAAFSVSAAVTAINERDVSGKAQAFSQYQTELGLTALQDRITAAGAVEVARLLDDFRTTDTSSVYPKVLSALQSVEAGKRPTEPVRPPVSVGGGGGGGIGGGATIPVTKPSGDENNYVPSNQAGSSRFSDVGAEHWANSYINELVGKGVLNGYGDNTFCPENTVSREELVTMIVKAFSLDGSKQLGFSDVSLDFWANEYIETALACGIINGVSESEFGLGMGVSRQDMAVLIDRTLAYLQQSLADGELDFSDGEEISDYAYVSVTKLAKAGILNGFEDGTFRPSQTLTRAQAAKILSQALALLQ